MNFNAKATLHRKKPGESMGKMINHGTLADMIRRVMRGPASKRDQYFIMVGDAIYSAADIDALKKQIPE